MTTDINTLKDRKFSYFPCDDEEYISLSYLTRCHKMFPDSPYKNTLCSRILDGPLNIENIISGYDLDDSCLYILEDDLQCKFRVLEAIDCFKFAIENGYTYHYDKSKYIADVKESFYGELDNILDLCYIDLQEIRDFIKYYFSLFPKINDDYTLYSL